MYDKRYRYLQSLDIGIDLSDFSCRDLLFEAFTHKSYSADTPGKGIAFNERLEFLGDSLLGAVVAVHLWNYYSDLPESTLTLYKIYLVKESTLAKVARNIGLGNVLRLGKGEEKSGGRDKDAILSDSLEALIGFLYLCFGREAIEKFIQKYIIVELSNAEDLAGKSFKTRLQERVQKKRKEVPVYRDSPFELEENGNVISYKSDVYVRGKYIASGVGASKKKAQENCAEVALKALLED